MRALRLSDTSIQGDGSREWAVMIYVPVILGATLVIIGIALIIGHILDSSEMGRGDIGPKRPTFNTTYPGIILIVIGAVMFMLGR